MESAETNTGRQAGAPQIPEYLVYEVLDGKPIYYKGYREVLNQQKKLEDIMGSSGLQAEIIEYLLRICYAAFDAKTYRVYTNEIGSHLSKNNNLSNDIAVFKKSVLTSKKVGPKYVDVPARIVFEIDLDAELEHLTEHEYVYTKVQKMLDFGVEKVFWVMTKTQKVLLATHGENWLIIDWNKDIELIDGHFFNVGRHLKEEGIDPATQS